MEGNKEKSVCMLTRIPGQGETSAYTVTDTISKTWKTFQIFGSSCHKSQSEWFCGLR